MNERQRAFVAEFLVSRNASKAARKAGYSVKTAHSQGERLLRNAEVRAAIDAGLARQAEKLEITAERVIRERARLAFADPGKLFDANGRPRPIQELDEDTRACITGIEVTQRTDQHGTTHTIKRYRLADKAANLTALEKRFGLDQKAIRFPLEGLGTVAGCTAAQARIAEAASRGELLPGDGQILSTLIENQRKALETSQLEARIAALEAKR